MSECVNWEGPTIAWDGLRGGYGLTRYPAWLDPQRRKTTAHRVAWAVDRKIVPPRWRIVMHTCDNRLCINPSHLILGTPKDNTQDMLRKDRGRWSTTRH